MSNTNAHEIADDSSSTNTSGGSNSSSSSGGSGGGGEGKDNSGNHTPDYSPVLVPLQNIPTLTFSTDEQSTHGIDSGNNVGDQGSSDRNAESDDLLTDSGDSNSLSEVSEFIDSDQDDNDHIDDDDNDDDDNDDEEEEEVKFSEMDMLRAPSFVMYSPRVDSSVVIDAIRNSKGGVGELESEDDTSPSPSPRPPGWPHMRIDSSSSSSSSSGGGGGGGGDALKLFQSRHTRLRLKGFLYQLTSFHQPRTSMDLSEAVKNFNKSIRQLGGRAHHTLKRGATLLQPSVGPWARRYFALTQDTLFVFASPLDRKALHFVECASIYRVERLPDLYKGREFAFAIRTYGRTYMLSAESESGMEKWITKLRESVRDCAAESINHSFRHLLNAFNGDCQPFVDTILQKMLNTVPEWTLRTMSTDVSRILQYMVRKDKLQREQGNDSGDDDNDLDEKVQSWEIPFSSIRLGKKIAEGFFGEVFKGTAWGKICAIKRLKLSSSADGNAKLIGKLKQEAALMAELRHPNVLLFIGLCTDPNNTLLVMEYASGGSLYDVLQNNVINDSTLQRMVQDICLGMNYLHQRNVLHLDLKPLNLLADSHFNIKVSDFGISRILKSKEENVHGPTGYGTVLYMADELIYGPSYGKSADVFSFGITLFELLWMREHPETNFVMEDSIGFNLLREPIAKKQKPIVPAWWPNVFKTLITDCCSDDPQARPSFEEIINDYLPKLENVEDDWWLSRHNARRIREIAEDPQRSRLELSSFDIWSIMSNYLLRTKDASVHLNILHAMIELATNDAEQNPAVLLDEVIERLEALVANDRTRSKFQEVVAQEGDFRKLCKLLESDFVVSLLKERVLAIILRLIEYDKVAILFLEQGIVKYFSEKLSSRLHLREPSTPQNKKEKEKKNYHRRNRSFAVTGIASDFAEKLFELPIAQILQRLSSFDDEKYLQRVVDDGGIDVLVYLSTEEGSNSSSYETMFVALQTLANLSIKDSKLATMIESKGVKPVQLATRAYLGALLRSNSGNFVNVSTTNTTSARRNDSSVENAFSKPTLQKEGEQVLPFMKLTFHRARERFNALMSKGGDSRIGNDDVDDQIATKQLIPSLNYRRLSSPSSRALARRSARFKSPASFSTLTEMLGHSTGKSRIGIDEPVIAKLWEMLKEEDDLDNIDCTKIRERLEAHFKDVLEQRRKFIEHQINQVVGQIDTPSRITDYLFLGSEWNSTNFTELKQLGIGYIVNVGAECPCYYPQHFRYAKIKFDRGNDLGQYFEEVFAFIDKARRSNSRALIHSHFGVSRSAAFTIAYLMRENGWSLQKSFKYVRDIRPIAQPHREYMRQLMEFEYTCSGHVSLGIQSLANDDSDDPFASPAQESGSPRSALDMSYQFQYAGDSNNDEMPGSPVI